MAPNNWYGTTFAASTGGNSSHYIQGSDLVTYSPCGHTVSGRQAAGHGSACPVCAQQHSLHAAMQAKQQAQAFQEMQAGYQRQRGYQGASASQVWIDEMQKMSGGIQMNPPEPTIMEWLDQEVASVCKLAFA